MDGPLLGKNGCRVLVPIETGEKVFPIPNRVKLVPPLQNGEGGRG
jgi:hypothetical protein